MKKILTVLLGLVAVTSACQADVLVYKIKDTATLTGIGAVTKDSVTGWVVLDPQNILVTVLNVVKARGGFQVRSFTNGFVEVLNGGAKTYTDISLPGAGFGAEAIIGVNTTLITSTATTYSAPKVMTISGNDLVNSDQLEIDNGTLSYDQTTTTTQNMLGGDFGTTVTNLTQILLNEGLTEFPTKLTR